MPLAQAEGPARDAGPSVVLTSLPNDLPLGAPPHATARVRGAGFSPPVHRPAAAADATLAGHGVPEPCRGPVISLRRPAATATSPTLPTASRRPVGTVSCEPVTPAASDTWIWPESLIGSPNCPPGGAKFDAFTH